MVVTRLVCRDRSSRSLMMELSEVVVLELELEDEVVAVAEEEEALRKWLPSGPPPTRWAKGEVFEVRRLRTSEGSLLEREDSLRAAPPIR